MRKITILTWKLIGCIIIFLILSVNTASAINTQNNTDGSINPDTNNTNNTNINSSGDNDLLTTYNYKGVYIDLPEETPTIPKVMDNFAGSYMFLDKFLNVLGIHPPHGHGFIYALKWMFYIIKVILATLLWMVYSLGWLIITVIWCIYCLVMQIAILVIIISIAGTMEKLGDTSSYYKYFSITRTVVDPEKVMGKFYNNIFHNTSGENNSSIIGDRLLFYPVNPLNINPNINNSNNVIITNNDNDTNKTNDTVIYDVMSTIIGSDIPDENGNINCSNITNSTNCINSNNIINCDNVVNSNYVSNSNGIANSSNIINSINVTNSSNVTNSNTIVGSNNIIKSSIISSSNDINDSNNLNGINNSTNLNNSVNSSDLKDSDNLINCNNVSNSSNSISCNDSTLLINCINSKNATNCSNSTYVFDMENRTNEYRQPDGYLHVLSTEYVKMPDGTYNPCKIKINDTIPPEARGTIVDDDNCTIFYTYTDNNLIKFFNDTVKQIDELNNSIKKLEDHKKNSEIATNTMYIISCVSLIVSITIAIFTYGKSKDLQTGENGVNNLNSELKCEGLKMVETHSGQAITRGGAKVVMSGIYTGGSVSLIPLIVSGSVFGLAIIGFVTADVFLGIYTNDYKDNYGKYIDERSFKDSVIECSVLESGFRAINKVKVDDPSNKSTIN